MNGTHEIRTTRLSPHVIQFAVPTPTLPPAFETNTYLMVSDGLGILVDAGTRDEQVLQSLVDKVRDHGVERVVAILATHYHRDHTQGLPYLQTIFDAPIYVHSLDMAGARNEMNQVGVDVRGIPEHMLCGSLSLEIRHTPGHTHGHVHVLIPEDGVILVGDHLAGDGSVWIGPPDGHMGDYYDALNAIMASGFRIAGPGHGNALPDAVDAAQRLKERREARETQIATWLRHRSATLQEIVTHLYGDTVPAQAMWVAKKTVQAHLVHMINQQRVTRTYESPGKFMYGTK